MKSQPNSQFPPSRTKPFTLKKALSFLLVFSVLIARKAFGFVFFIALKLKGFVLFKIVYLSFYALLVFTLYQLLLVGGLIYQKWRSIDLAYLLFLKKLFIPVGTLGFFAVTFLSMRRFCDYDLFTIIQISRVEFLLHLTVMLLFAFFVTVIEYQFLKFIFKNEKISFKGNI